MARTTRPDLTCRLNRPGRRDTACPPPAGRHGFRALAGLALFGVLACARLVALSPDYDLDQFSCRTWNRQSGLPASGINAIEQTPDGYLWLGTAAGLVRFDGLSFKVHDLGRVAGVRSSNVTSLAPRSGGSGLWVGLEHSAFGRFDGQTFTFLGRKDRGRTDMNVRSVFEGGDGALRIAAERHLAVLTPEGVYSEIFGSAGTIDYDILCALEDDAGRIWVGTAYQGGYFIENGKASAIPDPSLRNVLIHSLARDADGRLWVGTDKGLRCYDANLQRRELPLLEVPVEALLVDRYGSVWIGTHGRGLGRYRNGRYEFLGTADGLASAYINALMEDREGSLWVGTRDGLSQVTGIKFPTYAGTELPTAREAWSVAASRRGGVWIGTSIGLTYFDGTRQTISTEGLAADPLVKRVFEASDGDVYAVLGGWARTLVRFSGGRVVATYTAPNMLVGIAEDEGGVVVSCGGSLYRVKGDKLEPYAFSGGEPTLLWVLNLAPARDGGIWVACVAGIFHIKDGVCRGWPVSRLGLEVPVVGVVEDGEGVVWAGTFAGIIRLKEGGLRFIDRDAGMFDNSICAIVPDDSGNLWIDSGRGIFRVSRADMNAFADGRAERVPYQAFDGPESVRTTDKSSQERVACRTPDGRIWFPGPRGAVAIDPTKIPANPIAPPVHIDSARANGRDYEVGGEAVVPPGRGELEFHFTALSYIAPHRMKFKYRLEGYDDDWVDAGDRRLAFYTNLKPGAYTFRVIAANVDGVWNRVGDAMRVELQPRFHQTRWFYFAAAGSVGALLGGVYLARMNYLNRRQQALQRARDELELEVRKRTGELADANTSLIREIDERRRTEVTLAQERDLLRTLLDSCPDTIYFKDAQSRFVLVSRSKLDEVVGRVPDLRARRADKGLPAIADETYLLDGMSDFDTYRKEEAERSFEDEQRIIATGESLIGKLEKHTYPGGELRWALTNKMPWRNPEGKIIGTFGVSKDVTELKEAERTLAELHSRLLEASRRAGMAEVATGVLHNVGNVLNSVNVSATLVAERVRRSRVGTLGKVARWLREQITVAGAASPGDPRMQQLPAYLETLAEHLSTEQNGIVGELEALRKNIDHIKEIVAMQQSYGKVTGVVETVSLVELVEDAVHLNASALARHEVEMVKDYQVRPELVTEKHKVLQILVNLIRNAKHACDESGRSGKRITVRVTGGEGRVTIAVADNGIGIPAENVTRIFSHGFTTRKEGHGFGLHSSALAARELGGSLSVHSDGPNKGAVFTLEIPEAPPSNGEQHHE